MRQQIQMAMFLKNFSMLGAALFFPANRNGPAELDARRVPVRSS
jgi:hypothetical protein